MSPVDRRYLRKNYRNTHQILAAGLALLKRYGNLTAVDNEVKTLPPELSVHEGPVPLAVKADTPSAEREFIVRYVAEQLEVCPDTPICIVVCGLREDDTAQIRKIWNNYLTAGLTIRLLTDDSQLLPGGVYLSSFETVKGFEFGLVVISQCGRKYTGC